MQSTALALLCLLPLAPVPRERPTPDRTGMGYMGIYVLYDQTKMQVQVSRVTEDGGAAKAGIRDGDIIVAVGHFRPRNSDDLIARLKSYRPGETIMVTIERGREQQLVRVLLGRRPEEMDRVPTLPDE